MRSGDRPGPGRPATRADRSRPSAPAGGAGPVLGIGWFPAEVFPTALDRWPQLAGLWQTRDYATYCALLEAAMVTYSRSASPRLVPIDPDRLTAWAHARGLDPGSEQARSGYSADQTRADTPGPIWPPAETAACWCGSGTPYAHCHRTGQRGAAFRRG